MEQYISVPSGALALHAQDFKAYALLRQMAEFPQPGVPLSVAAAQATCLSPRCLPAWRYCGCAAILVVLPDIARSASYLTAVTRWRCIWWISVCR